MNIIECMQTMVQRPGYVAVLPGRRLIVLNNAGYLIDATKEKAYYPNLNVKDLLAVVWECWTPEQLQELGKQQPLG